MSRSDREDPKGTLSQFLKDPLQVIASAAGDKPESLEALRGVILNGSHTPSEHVRAALSMLFAHLSAGDQSSFNPTGTLPPRLRQYEARALLSIAGVYSILSKYTSSEALNGAPVKDLVKNWPAIRRWIQYFFYRALAGAAPSSSTTMNEDEIRLAEMGDDWSVFNMVLVILTFVRQDSQFFSTVLSNDETFPLILKLWARLVRTPSASTDHRTQATMLLVDCLQLSKAAGSLGTMRGQLLREVDGDAIAIATFVIEPLRGASVMTPSEFSSQAPLLATSMHLIHQLLEGVTGGVDERPIFGRAFFGNPETSPRPFMPTILTKYTAIRGGSGDLPYTLREIIRWSFKLCSAMLVYQGAIDFVLKLMDNGLLEAYANLVSVLGGLTDQEINPAAVLLKQDIATLLSHESVISATKNALHRLEKERKSDYKALKATESGLKDAWLYFTGHAFERAIFKGVYDAKFRKEDKLSCHFCHVRMNERKLKKCSGCKFVHYCSTECQTKDWKEHKKDCKLLARNLEVYNTKADTGHFFEHLMRSDIRRHLPGLNALASRNPRTRGDDALIAYVADYTFAPPTFNVIPATDVADDTNYVDLGLAFNPISQANRREIVEKVRSAKGKARIVQVEMRGHAGTPVVTFHTIGPEDFKVCFPAVPSTFNAERPRACYLDDNVLAVQSDWTDIVMVDAIYGRMLPHDEFHMYMADYVHLGADDQEKTVFQRVDDAVRRRKDQKEAPCCRDHSGHSI